MPLNGFLDQGGLSYLWGKITGKIATSEANVTAKIPKKTSQLENDSNFVKKTDMPTASSTRPKAPTAYGTVGTGTKYAREDHQHPKQTVKEAEIEWGGGSLKGNVTPIDAAMIPMIGYNKTECAKPAGITIEYSNDAGATWVDYGLSDRGKSNLVSICGDSSVFIGGGTSITQKTPDDQLRITVNAQKCGTYTALKKILIEMSTNGATDTKVLIEKAKGTAPTEFSEIGTYDIIGWSGWNSIDIGQVYFGGGTEQNMWVLRFTFTIGGLNSGNYKNALQVMHILFLGNTNWSTPSDMARTGHLYKYDADQNAIFPANVKAAAFTGSANGLTSTFDTWSVRDNIASGNNLTTIFSKIRRMFADLKSLAFKDKVDKADLSDAVQASLTKADSALDDAKTYTDTKVGAHNQDTAAHQDLRTELGKKEVAGAAAAVQTNLDTHANNTNIHVTAEEKAKIANAVLYTSQNLTDTQKEQTRKNINAVNGTFKTVHLDQIGWYRIATCNNSGGGILSLQHGYGSGGPSSLKFLVTMDIYTPALKCIDTDCFRPQFTNARMVKLANNMTAIDVYYNIAYDNSPVICFIQTGQNSVAIQEPSYISNSDALPDGETLLLPMEYLNPPMKLGIEYRTTERYNGNVVYKKLDTDGIVKWRADGDTTWHAAVTYGTSDLTAGTSALPTGQLYVVYE